MSRNRNLLFFTGLLAFGAFAWAFVSLKSKSPEPSMRIESAKFLTENANAELNPSNAPRAAENPAPPTAYTCRFVNGVPVEARSADGTTIRYLRDAQGRIVKEEIHRTDGTLEARPVDRSAPGRECAPSGS